MRVQCSLTGLKAALACAALMWVAPFNAPAQSRLQPALPLSSSSDEQNLRLNTELISLTVTVTDKQGRAVTGLDKTFFSIFENGVQQQISFFSHCDAPVSVVIIFDASGSMDESKIARARQALATFVQASHHEDEYSLISFNQRAQLLLDRVRDSELLLQRVAALRPSGHTALYDAVATGLEQLAHSAYPRRTLIVLSDGEDNRSRLQFDQLQRQVREADATIYVIGTTMHGTGKQALYQMQSIAALGRLAAASGGRAFFPQGAAEMIDVFAQIALELRQQYSLGYAPDNFIADGRWRQLKVQVKAPTTTARLSVRHRAGYFAAAGGTRRSLLDLED